MQNGSKTSSCRELAKRGAVKHYSAQGGYFAADPAHEREDDVAVRISARIAVESDTGAYFLKHRVRHSPSGFAWGYCGSGPADLALSILWDYLGDEPEAWLYQDFKTDVLSKLNQNAGWTICGRAIRDWLLSRIPPGQDTSFPGFVVEKVSY